MTEQSTEAKKPAKPIFRKKLPHGISAAVFENEREGRIYRSINLQRSYRKGDTWARSSIYFDHEHIPFAIDALEGILRFLNDFPVGYSQAAESGDEHADELESAN